MLAVASVTVAAVYAHGLARNHPFVDGNKRVAFLAAGLKRMLVAVPEEEVSGLGDVPPGVGGTPRVVQLSAEAESHIEQMAPSIEHILAKVRSLP